MLANQNELLTTTRDGILALARNTGSAFRDQESLINSRFSELAALWSEPMDTWTKKLEDERIEREKEQLRDVRRWLSVATPERNLLDAKGKRQMHLGGWLLEDPNFRKWEQSEFSSFLWLYAFAGTGKNWPSLSCRPAST